jgi:hypothetical protein
LAVTTAFVDGDMAWEIPAGWLVDDQAHAARCRSCHRPVLWVRNAKSGKAAPFDAIAPDAVLDGLTVSVSHFATCPEADSWRKR